MKDKKKKNKTNVQTKNYDVEQLAPNNYIIYRADLSQCTINRDENSKNIVIDGISNYVVSFGGQDFKCRVDPTGGIIITPLLGDKFYLTVPNGLGPVEGGYPLGSVVGTDPLDHVKFLAYTAYVDAPDDDKGLCVTWLVSGKQLGVDNHPYNKNIINPHEDLRLSSYGCVTLDPETFIINDWIGTDDYWYAFIERIPGAEKRYGLYASYTYAFPIIKKSNSYNILQNETSSKNISYCDDKKKVDKILEKSKGQIKETSLGDFYHLQIIYNKNKRTYTWIANGIPRFKITDIGVRLNESNTFIYENKIGWIPVKNTKNFQIFERGGDDNPQTPKGFKPGNGFFTFLDGFLPNNVNGIDNQPLVRLNSMVQRVSNSSGDNAFFYNNPLSGLPATFLYDCPIMGEITTSCISPDLRLFSQGAIMRIKELTVSYNE